MASNGPPLARAHGGPIADELARLGIRPDELIDFSASVNPYGPSPEVAEAIRHAPLGRYPDPTARDARCAVARYHDTAPERVVVGNGSADLLWTLARVLLEPGDAALIVEPTFAEFRAAASFQKARIHEWRATEAAGFTVDLDGVSRLASAIDAKVVYLCSPNTPTGTVTPASEVAAFAEAHRGRSIVFDQAFVTLSEAFLDERTPLPENVVRVRSLTKDHAIPGLRVGYLVAAEPLARRLETARPAWTTSAVAERAVVAALEQRDFVAESRRRMLADRDELARALTRVGAPTVPSAACFLVARVGSGARLRARLLPRRILVRDCASFGLPEFIRVAARPTADVQRLALALSEELGGC
jgi:histidinol-phosphate/aromatic aminotransferase/cobyric acid decarboxylase-like protein